MRMLRYSVAPLLRLVTVVGDAPSRSMAVLRTQLESAPMMVASLSWGLMSV